MSSEQEMDVVEELKLRLDMCEDREDRDEALFCVRILARMRRLENQHAALESACRKLMRDAVEHCDPLKVQDSIAACAVALEAAEACQAGAER